MKIRYLIVALLLIALMAGLGLLYVPAVSKWALNSALKELNSQGIMVVKPRMTLLAGHASAERITVRDGGATGPSLFSAQGVEVDFSVFDLLFADFTDTAIGAQAAQVYVSTTDGVADPSPLEWLDYHRWMPDEVRVGVLHIIHQAPDTHIVRFSSLSGIRGRNLSYQLTGDVDYENTHLSLDWELKGLQASAHSRELTSQLHLASPNGNQVALAGAMRGSSTSFTYELSLDGHFNRLQDLPVALATGIDIEGALELKGEIAGDEHGFAMTGLHGAIDKHETYRYLARGTLNYSFAGSSAIDLQVTGQMPDLQHLVNWVDTDLSMLGSAEVAFDLAGSVEQPVLESISITTRSPEGLVVKAQGDVDFSTEHTAISEGMLEVEASAPSLLALKPWIGELGTDIGPFRAEAQLRFHEQALHIDSASAEFGDNYAATLLAQGYIIGADGSHGLDLQLGLALPGELAMQWLNLTPPASAGFLNAFAQVQSQGETYQFRKLALEHTPSGLTLEAEGELAGLDSTDKLTLSGIFRQLKLSYISTLLPGDASIDNLAGSLAGHFSFSRDQGKLNLTRFMAQTLDTEQLSLAVQGSVKDIMGELDARFSTAVDINDRTLLVQHTGLAMGVVTATAETSIKDDRVNSQLQADIGNTAFTGNVQLQMDDGTIRSLSTAIQSPHVALADLGLQVNSTEQASYVPADQLKPLTEHDYFERLLTVSPPFDTDFKLQLAGLTGETTQLDSLNLHLTGADHRYMIRDFTVGYQGGHGELRGVIDLTAQPPFFSIAGDVREMPMSTLTQDLGIDSNVRGNLSVQGGITGRGTTSGAIATSASGRLAVAAEDLIIKGAAYDVLATDLLAWLYRGLSRQESTHFNCAMASFDLNTGIADSDSLLIESSRMIADGTATVNLKSNQLNIQLLPRSRTRAIHIPAKVQIKGSFDNPKVTTSPIAAMLDATAEFVSLIPKMALKLLHIKKRKKYYTPCVPQSAKLTP